MKTPIKKSRDTIFLFRITHEAAVRNGKILEALKVDLGTGIAAKKDSPINYGS